MEYVMQFDEQAPATASERELVPEGEHQFEIVRASESGAVLELALAHADKRYGWVWANTPRDKGWGKKIVSSLVHALGMTPAEFNGAKADALVGRIIAAEVYHKLGTTGRTFVNVARFANPDETAPQAPAAAPTKSKAKSPKAGWEDADAIPF